MWNVKAEINYLRNRIFNRIELPQCLQNIEYIETNPPLPTSIKFRLIVNNYIVADFDLNSIFYPNSNNIRLFRSQMIRNGDNVFIPAIRFERIGIKPYTADNIAEVYDMTNIIIGEYYDSYDPNIYH